MNLLSPIDDFRGRTLAFVIGTLEKLRFCSELREGDGKYHHWGMERVHGERNTHEAISNAHTELFLSVLEKNIRELVAEVNEIAPEGNVQEYVAALERVKGTLMPINMGGGLADHFTVTLETLSRLASRSNLPNRRGASQPQPPVR